MNIRMDENTRRQLQEFAGHIGIPATSLVNASIRQMLRSKRIVLDTGLEPTPYLEKIIRDVEADYEAGRNISGPFKTADEVIAALEI